MTRARASDLLFRTITALSIALFLTRIAIALSTSTEFHRFYGGNVWPMVLIPSSPWLLLWLVTGVAGWSRWSAIRFVLAGASPLFIWQAIDALGSPVARSLTHNEALWTYLDAILQLMLAMAGLASVVVWWLGTRVRKASARDAKPPRQ